MTFETGGESECACVRERERERERESKTTHLLPSIISKFVSRHHLTSRCVHLSWLPYFFVVTTCHKLEMSWPNHPLSLWECICFYFLFSSCSKLPLKASFELKLLPCHPARPCLFTSGYKLPPIIFFTNDSYSPPFMQSTLSSVQCYH